MIFSCIFSIKNIHCCSTHCPKRWANEREIYTCWIAKFIFKSNMSIWIQINQQSQCMFIFVFVFIFVLFFFFLSFSFVSFCLVVIVFVRSRFCNLISRLKIAIVILHIQSPHRQLNGKMISFFYVYLCH